MSIVIVMSSIVSAVATVVIAIFAYKSHQATSLIREGQENWQAETAKRDEEFRGQVSDLYNAIVLATLLSPRMPADIGDMKATFNAMYTGDTPIFKEPNKE